MHTYRYDTKGAGEALVIVNSDWSGDAFVRWDADGEHKEVVVPGAVLKAIAMDEARELLKEHFERFVDSL